MSSVFSPERARPSRSFPSSKVKMNRGRMKTRDTACLHSRSTVYIFYYPTGVARHVLKRRIEVANLNGINATQ
jgi:hypothetical protein